MANIIGFTDGSNGFGSRSGDAAPIERLSGMLVDQQMLPFSHCGKSYREGLEQSNDLRSGSEITLRGRFRGRTMNGTLPWPARGRWSSE
jgi:hypothetical protein